MENLDNIILFLIDQTSKNAKRYSQREFDQRKMGISVDQWVLLKVIEENPGLSQKELADKSIRDGASITRSLDLLEKKKLIKRVEIPDNRRQYQIHLTETGRLFIQEHMQLVNQHRAQSLAGFSAEEIEVLKSMLVRIQKNMS